MKKLKEMLNKEYSLTPLFLLKIVVVCVALGCIIALLTATGGVFFVLVGVLVVCIDIYKAFIKPTTEDPTEEITRLKVVLKGFEYVAKEDGFYILEKRE